MAGPTLSSEQRSLVRSELRLVEALARRESRRFPRVPYEEFVSVGNEALARAVLNYDRIRGPFGVFAYLRVQGEMRDFAMRETIPLRASIARALRLGSEAFASAYDDAEGGAAHDTPAEGKERLSRWARDTATAFATAYLLSASTAAAADAENAVAADRDAGRMNEALRAALGRLEDDDAALVREHYEEGLLLTQIAERRRITVRTVHRHHRKALKALRKHLASLGFRGT